jgi:hypothetical protein
MAPTDSTHTSDDKKDNVPAEQIAEVQSTSTGPEGDEERTLWQNIKKYRKVVYVTFGLTSAILLYGYDNVVVGTIAAMPVFQYVVSAP